MADELAHLDDLVQALTAALAQRHIPGAADIARDAITANDGVHLYTRPTSTDIVLRSPDDLLRGLITTFTTEEMFAKKISAMPPKILNKVLTHPRAPFHQNGFWDFLNGQPGLANHVAMIYGYADLKLPTPVNRHMSARKAPSVPPRILYSNTPIDEAGTAVEAIGDQIDRRSRRKRRVSGPEAALRNRDIAVRSRVSIGPRQTDAAAALPRVVQNDLAEVRRLRSSNDRLTTLNAQLTRDLAHMTESRNIRDERIAELRNTIEEQRRILEIVREGAVATREQCQSSAQKLDRAVRMARRGEDPTAFLVTPSTGTR